MEGVAIWRRAPFLRMLIPLIIGIVLQWHVQIHIHFILGAAIFFAAILFCFGFISLADKFIYDPLRGISINLLLLIAGLFFTWMKDIRNDTGWFHKVYNKTEDHLIIRINEPLIEKPRSYKALGEIELVIGTGEAHHTTGKLLLYFQKDSTLNLKYGDRIIIKKPLQQIKNSGNPGGFDFAEFSAMHQTYHQLYLTKQDWVRLDETNPSSFKQFIYRSRDAVLQILRQYMGSDEGSLGIAEALLIGYTRDLDKDLVKAYANTGVVHIIAISGLHLGLIYVMLLWITKRTPLLKRSGVGRMIIILGSLWLFSFLTGGSASVLRSAVMFSCIVIGESLGKKSSIINSLACSAFMLLCYNPFYVWDVGFQLSYFAIGGIIILQRSIYCLLYVRNKWLDKVWQMSSVTIAAQVFTFPVCLYYFHQFPNLFLFTNLIAVPLSSVILFMEIALICIAWIPSLGAITGKLCTWLILRMNDCIQWFNAFDFSVSANINCSFPVMLLLYAFITFLLMWLYYKMKISLFISLISLLSMMSVISSESWDIKTRHTIVVYNIPGANSIDTILGVKPNHSTIQRANDRFYHFKGKTILMLDSSIKYISKEKTDIDLVVISKNPRIMIADLVTTFRIKQIVIDASNSLWKIDKWKKECELLHLPCHSVQERGAFVTEF